MYPLPYELFLSKLFEYYNLDVSKEISISLTHNNIIKLNTLHHMGIIPFDNEWAFKDETPPLSTDTLTQFDIQQSFATLTLSI